MMRSSYYLSEETYHRAHKCNRRRWHANTKVLLKSDSEGLKRSKLGTREKEIYGWMVVAALASTRRIVKLVILKYKASVARER